MLASKLRMLYFGLDGGIPLQARDGDKIHIIGGQLRKLGNHRLNKDGGLGGIYAAGQVIERHLDDIIAHLLRVLGVVR